MQTTSSRWGVLAHIIVGLAIGTAMVLVAAGTAQEQREWSGQVKIASEGTIKPEPCEIAVCSSFVPMRGEVTRNVSPAILALRAAPEPPPAPVARRVTPVAAPTLPVSEMMARVGGCESGSGPNSPINWTAENPRSSASGGFQFISSTWRSVTGLEPPASAYPPDVQIQAFLTLWNGGAGASHWNPSRPCWD